MIGFRPAFFCPADTAKNQKTGKECRQKWEMYLSGYRKIADPPSVSGKN
jgi:hypothetical protein